MEERKSNFLGGPSAGSFSAVILKKPFYKRGRPANGTSGRRVSERYQIKENTARRLKSIFDEYAQFLRRFAQERNLEKECGRGKIDPTWAEIKPKEDFEHPSSAAPEGKSYEWIAGYYNRARREREGS